MPKNSSVRQQGFVPIFVLIAVVGVVGFGLLNLKVSDKTPQNPDVKGILLARGGDGGGSSGGGDGSEDGRTSGSSGSPIQPPSNGGPGPNGQLPHPAELPFRTVSFPSPRPQVGAPESTNQLNVSPKPEDKNEDIETENDLEQELGKLEAKIEFKNVGGDLEIGDEASESGRGQSLNKGKKIKLNVAQKTGSGEAEIETEDGGVRLAAGGVSASSKFPLSFDPTTNELFVNTPNGPRPIRVLPDQASAVATASGIQNRIDSIEVVQTSAGQDDLAFDVKGEKVGNLLGLIPVSAPVQTEVGAQTGEILNTTEPFWLKILSPLIR